MANSFDLFEAFVLHDEPTADEDAAIEPIPFEHISFQQYRNTNETIGNSEVAVRDHQHGWRDHDQQDNHQQELRDDQLRFIDHGGSSSTSSYTSIIVKNHIVVAKKPPPDTNADTHFVSAAACFSSFPLLSHKKNSFFYDDHVQQQQDSFDQSTTITRMRTCGATSSSDTSTSANFFSDHNYLSSQQHLQTAEKSFLLHDNTSSQHDLVSRQKNCSECPNNKEGRPPGAMQEILRSSSWEVKCTHCQHQQRQQQEAMLKELVRESCWDTILFQQPLHSSSGNTRNLGGGREKQSESAAIQSNNAPSNVGCTRSSEILTHNASCYLLLEDDSAENCHDEYCKAEDSLSHMTSILPSVSNDSSSRASSRHHHHHMNSATAMDEECLPVNNVKGVNKHCCCNECISYVSESSDSASTHVDYDDFYHAPSSASTMLYGKNSHNRTGSCSSWCSCSEAHTDCSFSTMTKTNTSLRIFPSTTSTCKMKNAAQLDQMLGYPFSTVVDSAAAPPAVKGEEMMTTTVGGGRRKTTPLTEEEASVASLIITRSSPSPAPPQQQESLNRQEVVLVRPSDQMLTTGYYFSIFKNVVVTSFEEDERFGNRSHIELGFPGIACCYCNGENDTTTTFGKLPTTSTTSNSNTTDDSTFCASPVDTKQDREIGQHGVDNDTQGTVQQRRASINTSRGAGGGVTLKYARTGRYFPTSFKNFADDKKLILAIYNHLIICKKCPDRMKELITSLKSKHKQEQKLLARGSRSLFLKRVWRRLHRGNHSHTKKKSTDSQSHPTAE
eukprot:CAMPEP_0176504758 /NCGR_PEP_ID=MMETSP0200_2-20121128/16116_1 /TAXON_ID=947934 /ORGANISM="Chaetoceros sp., Strain GSL56" /LENGTH=782 /DNA_ID=CAMNT_0017904235 /DNA_START=52 /DNA_END=2401 /DNA_ORIENTATION=-